MKIEFKDSTQTIEIELDQTDLQQALEIDEMMQTKGWQYLTGYMLFARESMIAHGKNGIKSTGARDFSALRWACLKGLDEAVEIPRRIVARAQEHLKKQKEDLEKEAANAANAGSDAD